MALPPDLLAAVAAVGGGRLSLIIGAGCSIEAPTCVPIASVCSTEVHRRLVADGLLAAGECPDPSDLSVLADSVFARHGAQRHVVDRFAEQYNLKLASPNSGYLIAAAMLCEGAVSSVVTLNFDLALTSALSQLGSGQAIGLIESPADLPHQKTRNVYYLHRNVNAGDPEAWVLRSAALQHEWKGHWEPIVAGKVLTSPVVVFAGLGTPISVLIETAGLIRAALPNATFFQVDPGKKDESKVFTTLKLEDANYIQLKWGDFMNELAQRLVNEHVAKLAAAITRKTTEDRLPAEDTAAVENRLVTIGLVNLGKARARWLLHDRPYCPDDDTGRAQVADLLLAAQMVARVANAELRISDDSLVEFHRDGRVSAVYLLASGRGHRGKASMEAQIEFHRGQLRSRSVPPIGALVGGTSDVWTTPLIPPEDVVRGTTSGDIVTGPSALPMFHISDLRNDNTRISGLVP